MTGDDFTIDVPDEVREAVENTPLPEWVEPIPCHLCGEPMINPEGMCDGCLADLGFA
jgi:hypothetical protein